MAYSTRKTDAGDFAVHNAAGAMIGKPYATERQAKRRLRDLCRADHALAQEVAGEARDLAIKRGQTRIAMISGGSCAKARLKF